MCIIRIYMLSGYGGIYGPLNNLKLLQGFVLLLIFEWFLLVRTKVLVKDNIGPTCYQIGLSYISTVIKGA